MTTSKLRFGFGQMQALLLAGVITILPRSADPKTRAIRPVASVSAASTSSDQLYASAARTAWLFVERNYRPETGLVRAHDTYQFVTTWDIASAIAAIYSAHELKLLSDADYDTRIRRILATLSTMELFDKAAFNKSYSSETGRMIGRDTRTSSAGFGWSSTDLGRLLLWLRILAVNQPRFADQATAVVRRFDMGRLIRDGYLVGASLDDRGIQRTFQEGRLGYEQYAAAGFAVWGARADNALDARANSTPVNVLGVTIFADKRRGDNRITSEPYIMLGLETGWYAPALREQAMRVLAAQEARYKSTGIVTIVSEDALPDPPYYFYYYSVYYNGKTFIIDSPAASGFLDRPRWVSAKAAFGWNAVLPSAYTALALQAVQPAAIPGRGWGAGTYEGTGRPTGVASLNTAAVILESAAYNAQDKPFLPLTMGPKGP